MTSWARACLRKRSTGVGRRSWTRSASRPGALVTARALVLVLTAEVFPACVVCTLTVSLLGPEAMSDP